MPIITATERATYYVAVAGGTVIDAGITRVGDATATGDDKTLQASADENEFLGLVAGTGGSYKPLPEAGTALEAGDIYSHNGDLVIVRQSHTRTEHAPADVPALFSVYRENDTDALDWIANEEVYVGTIRIYGGTEYICIQAHTTQSDWQPPNVPTLWNVVLAETDEWQTGIAYAIADIVTYGGTEYRCIQAHTAQVGWQPPNVPALWGVV